MTSVNQFWRRAKLPLAVSLASTLAGPAFGVSFNIGEIEGSFDSSLSVGASWSTAKPNSDLIGVNNGGKGLPILGASFIKLENPSASAGKSGTYGITWDHRFTR